MIGIVSRLIFQKGFHLVLDELTNFLEQDVQLVLLGTGDPGIEHSFRSFGERYPDKISVNIKFDVSLAQLIYAGADLFWMPSETEPCGLSQMIAMRYGTLPIVHEVGGVKDTVPPYDLTTKTGTGFGFSEFSSNSLMYSTLTAIDLYRKDQQTWQQLIKNEMKKDFSWEKSSQVYLDLYKEIIQVG
ncbi:hypothetical protein A5819_003179 [Enterococcus sp. 7E2_DIV0204]|nr:hypothetical protein A5819_003179 [Enterococcus sp. 7E2_DIV0204]OTP48462.1 hypothetical protein A5884_003125 [Enterococcus sp. 7D2_DIV0200]